MSDPQFRLHPTIEADTLALCEWPLSRVLLMLDANYPWLILVPARPGLTRMHHLPEPERALLIEEISRASETLESLYKPDRINVGQLGNVVEQLHIHVLARFEDDAAWPGPVWGAAPRLAYGEDELAQTRERMAAALNKASM